MQHHTLQWLMVSSTLAAARNPQRIMMNSGCLTASSEIIHQGTLTLHHRMKTPKSSSLKDTTALNIELSFLLLEQTQSEQDNELHQPGT